MILDVPLCIAVAWGNIVYSVMEFSDATNLPRWVRPLLDGLLGLNIDLALDAVAIRLGFWDWGRGLQFQFFGVPYANFLAWFLVVASFSFGWRLVAQHKGRLSALLAGPAGLLVGLMTVFLTNAFMAFLLPLQYHILLAILILALAIIFITAQRPRFHTRKVAPLSFFVPVLTILYTLGAGFASGIFFEIRELLLVSATMLVILLVLHWPTLRHLFLPAAHLPESQSP